MSSSESLVHPNRTSSAMWPAEGLETQRRCPVCGSDTRALLYDRLSDRVFSCAPGEWTLYECSACGVGYLDPRPTEETISLAYSSYFTHSPADREPVEGMSTRRRLRRTLANGLRNWRYGTHEHPANRLGIVLGYLVPQARALIDLEFRHLSPVPRGRRLLDVGCGDGTFLRSAAAAGWNVIGVDPDPRAVAVARNRGLNAYCGTISRFENDPSSFDAVTLSHVIEHVHDPTDLLRRIYRVLKPGGLLWIDTPNVSSYSHRVFGRAWLGLDPPRHLVIFNYRSLRKLLGDVGFTTVRQVPRRDLMFAASYKVQTGAENPLQGGPYPLALRVRALWTRWRLHGNPERAEFITLIARKNR